MPAKFREVQSITIKRKHICLTAEDRYGHWWFEILDPTLPNSESYGWWPKFPVGVKQTFRGVPGELNGQTCFRGRPNRDPHHGDEADEEFHPYVPESDRRTDAQIAACLRAFAQSYNGNWQWVFGWGQNCHTFQEQAMRHCGLRKRPPKTLF
jgi:hypothetical protein